MNTKFYLIYLALFLLWQVLYGDARGVSLAATQQQQQQEQQQQQQEFEAGNRNGNSSTLVAGTEKTNSTTTLLETHANALAAASVVPSQSSPATATSSSSSSIVKHIRRKKRETLVDIPFDFFTNHMHCDFDQTGSYKILIWFPFTCVWLQNNRHLHEGWFRVYMQAQMEAFFFGQYYERLRRFELDPHTFDYRGMGM